MTETKFYTCPYHSVEVERGKECSKCLEHFETNPITDMTLEQRLAEFDLYYTDKFFEPVLTVDFHKLKVRLSQMLGGIGVYTHMMVGDKEKLRMSIEIAYNASKVNLDSR